MSITVEHANDRQVGGEHYKSSIQHWDYVIANDLDYFQAQITKYVTRWKKKGGLKDLEKAMHFLEKYIENHESYSKEVAPPSPPPVSDEQFQVEGYYGNGMNEYSCRLCRARDIMAANAVEARAHHQVCTPQQRSR